ncbi:hypothetical protein KYD98_17820 [Clostridium sp. YB-6]|uniref:Uncharacterized protein n=1 Tax=Clostridium weizhouense TaxID=2859781 RepID=A0ABS7ATE7_9CLOT|nr:hypothetical protein [Clostridium weizhouense]
MNIGALVSGVIAAVAKVNACSKDGKMSQDDAEEIVDMLCKALVGAFIARIGTGSSNSKNDEKVKEFFNSCTSTPNVNPKFEDNTLPLEAYLINKEYFNLKTSILKGSAKAEARANIFEDGKLRPNLKLGAEEEMKMVEFSAETKRFGDKDFGIQLDGNVTGIKEKAELGVYFGENKDTGKFDCCVKGGAIATLSEATATQKFTILGAEIEIEETGYAGGIGAEGKIGLDKGKMKAKIGACEIIGGSVSLSIGVAD